MKTLSKLGLTVALSALLVACGNGDTDTGVETENTDAEVTVEEVSENVEVQTEVWEETDEETGEEYEVTVVKHIENGKLVRSSESREPINNEEESDTDSGDTEELDSVEETVDVVAPETEEGVEGDVRVTTIEDDKVIVTDKDGEVVEELTLEEYESNGEE